MLLCLENVRNVWVEEYKEFPVGEDVKVYAYELFTLNVSSPSKLEFSNHCFMSF